MSYFERMFYDKIAQGGYSNIVPWSKIGYNPAIATTLEDLWSYGGEYVFPTAAAGMEVRSDDATADGDLGTILFNATCDTGGTTTTLVDAGVDFTATAVAGDILIVEKSGTTPEWGTITTVANGSLTFSNGLSSGGSCAAARTYQVLDASAATGAMAVKIEYLTSAYAQKSEIVILNTTTVVPTVNLDLYRVNSFRVIAVGTKAGATNACKGNLELRNLADTPIYSYITAGYTRARNIAYTIPASKTLYVVSWSVGWATPNDAKVQSCRFFTRANVEPSTGFNTGSLFYPYTELVVSNGSEYVEFPIPTKLPAKADIRVCGIGLTGANGPAATVLRGYLVS